MMTPVTSSASRTSRMGSGLRQGSVCGVWLWWCVGWVPAVKTQGKGAYTPASAFSTVVRGRSTTRRGLGLWFALLLGLEEVWYASLGWVVVVVRHRFVSPVLSKSYHV